MVRMDAAMRERRLQSRMLLQVHDELLFESPPDEVEIVSTLARQIMEAALPLDVPIVVDLKAGLDWSHT
jgi:DNA polymerase-1